LCIRISVIIIIIIINKYAWYVKLAYAILYTTRRAGVWFIRIFFFNFSFIIVIIKFTQGRRRRRLNYKMGFFLQPKSDVEYNISNLLPSARALAINRTHGVPRWRSGCHPRRRFSLDPEVAATTEVTARVRDKLQSMYIRLE